MLKPVAPLLLFAALACAAPADFNGRWDITVNEQSRKRAWWLEITGAGTPVYFAAKVASCELRSDAMLLAV